MRERTSLAAQLVNVLVGPSDVYEEIVAGPTRRAAWVIPTLLVSLASLFLIIVTLPSEQTSSTGPSEHWYLVSTVIAFVSALMGSLWSALVLWGISRIFLKIAVPFVKALEVASLAGMVLVLGTVTTALLILATGDPSARPALSLLVRSPERGTNLHAVLSVFDVFYFWSTAVLGIGLSRLTGVSLREGAFWCFGYWLVARISLILLG